MKTLHLSIITVVGIIILSNQIVPVHAELSNLSSPVTNDECVNKIMDSEKRQSATYDENKAIELAKNSQELKSKVVGYHSSFDHTSKYFVIDDQTCTAAWRYVEVVFNLQDSHGAILSQVIVTEDTQLTKVIASNVQAYSQSNVKMTNSTAGYMMPYTGLDSDVVLAMLLSVFAVTGFFITYFSKKLHIGTPLGISAARIFFAVFSMVFFVSSVLMLSNTIHRDMSYQQIFSVIGNIFFIVEDPNLYTTDSALAYFGNTDGFFRHAADVVVVALFAVVSTIATHGIWTRRHWSWKLCVGIMFVQLGLCVFSLQQGWGILISLFIPVLVILDLFRSDVRIYFHGEKTQ